MWEIGGKHKTQKRKEAGVGIGGDGTVQKGKADLLRITKF